MLTRLLKGNAGGQDALNLLQLSGQRLEGIADGLLARHKVGELGSQVFSIHEVLDELVGELQASPLGQGVEFKKSYHIAALYVTGDKTDMARAIGNVIKNALEAMQQNAADKPRQLLVTTTCHPEPFVALEGRLREGSQDSSALPQNDKIGPSVLLIDDDLSVRKGWGLMHAELGISRLISHGCVEEMIAAATNPARFDLCVIDKNIEGSQFDGARTLEYLRQNGAKTIVLASGETEEDIRNDVRFHAADGILKNKIPMTPDELRPFLDKSEIFA